VIYLITAQLHWSIEIRFVNIDKNDYPKNGEDRGREMNCSSVKELSMQHTFWTWSAQGKIDPVPVERADGVYFWDMDGKRYLDFNSMVMCVNIGHNNQHVIESMKKQMDELVFASPKMATRPRAVLGKMLAEITPERINRFLFTTGGAEANENAVKLARAFTGKHKILTRYRSYHGATAGALALTGDPRRTAWEPNLMPGVVHFLDPYRYRSVFHKYNPEISESDFARDYLAHLEEIIQFEGADSIAAVMLEPVTGTNGVIIPPDGYIQGVREICNENEILLIADEVMSGFGRTGEWFAMDHWSTEADIITMAKGLTSGYAPLGAVGMSDQIAEFFNENVYYGGLTYNSHPVCLAAAIANIEVMRDQELVEHSTSMGKQMRQMMVDLGERHPSIGDIRSIGLFGAIELVRNRETREPMADYDKTSTEMEAFKKEIANQGLFLIVHWNTILCIPPLIINKDELKKGFDIIDRALLNTDSAAAA
jgi:taurine--2-oxoglutarate transaminase